MGRVFAAMEKMALLHVDFNGMELLSLLRSCSVILLTNGLFHYSHRILSGLIVKQQTVGSKYAQASVEMRVSSLVIFHDALRMPGSVDR